MSRLKPVDRGCGPMVVLDQQAQVGWASCLMSDGRDIGCHKPCRSSALWRPNLQAWVRLKRSRPPTIGDFVNPNQGVLYGVDKIRIAGRVAICNSQMMFTALYSEESAANYCMALVKFVCLDYIRNMSYSDAVILFTLCWKLKWQM